MEQGSNQRKNQKKCRRGRRRKILFIYRCMWLGVLVVTIFLVLKWYQGWGEEEEVQLPVWGQELPEKGEYPESLWKLLEQNPETEEFVLNYFEARDASIQIDLAEDVSKGTIPLFLQWDKRWGYGTYGSDFLAVTGCGPTCLSMVYCGLSGDTKWNPLEVARMAEKHGYYVEGAGSSWELMSEGAEKLGITVKDIMFDEEHILSALKKGTPIICAMRPGDFTTSGHFIVLSGVDEEGKVIVRDPNSKINSEKSWDVEQLMSQIKNLWGYVYEE